MEEERSRVGIERVRIGQGKGRSGQGEGVVRCVEEGEGKKEERTERNMGESIEYRI